MSSWIKVHRSLWDKAWSNKPEYVALWLFLLKEAQHKPTEKMWNGKVITLAPGQLITGRLKMAVNTGIHRSKVERILKLFEIEHQIEQQTTNTSRLITILNYSKYQSSEQQIEQQVSNKRATDEQRMSTIQELKNERMKDNKRGADLNFSKRAQKFVDFVNEKLSKKYRLIPKVEAAFRERIEIDKYTSTELVTVVESVIGSTFHIESGFKYCTPEFLLKQETIEKYKGGAVVKSASQSFIKPKPDYTAQDDFYKAMQG